MDFRVLMVVLFLPLCSSESSNKTVDLVVLFDGSRSMLTSEFEKNKEFIEDIMTNLQNTSVRFAAVQFSRETRTVFTFNDYLKGDANRLLKKEPHMQSLTNTYQALRSVLKEHFENPANDASPEATKVLMLITDGDPNDNNNGIIETYDLKNIHRIVIGVKLWSLNKLKTIASEPRDKNIFQIENYDGLTEIRENILKRIFQTEGTKAEARCSTAPAESSNKTVDLVVLFDGSRSMLTSEFEKNKEFIEDIMTNLQNTSVRFAAVQFSKETRTVFTFNDYLKGDANRLLKKEPHMQSLTNTYQALRYVLKEHFENPANDASPEATKVLMLITDGDPSDNNNGIIETYDLKNIHRIVIGVKLWSLNKLKTIASEPRDKNIFQIENYDGLTEIRENILKRIFQTEDCVRLLRGPRWCSGSLNIFWERSWTSVCEEAFDLLDAEVTCRELGCGPPSLHQGALSGEGQMFRCEGHESALMDCPRSNSPENTCSSGRAVNLNCSDPVGVRLVGQPSRCVGTVEVRFQDQWRRMDYFDYWDQVTAAAVCQELNCGSAVSGEKRGGFGNSLVWPVSVECLKKTSALRDCVENRDFTYTSTGTYVVCSDLLTRPNISLTGVSEALTQELYADGVSEAQLQGFRVLLDSDFWVKCSIDPQYPGGSFQLLSPISQNHTLPAVNYSAHFLFSDAGPAHKGNYTCVYHLHVFNHTFSSQSHPLYLTLGASNSDLIIRVLVILLLKTTCISALYFYCKVYSSAAEPHSDVAGEDGLMHEAEEVAEDLV